MLDAATSELVKAGLGYALFLFACGVIGLMWRKIEALQVKINEDNKTYNAEIREIHEKRLAESREVVLAMERNTSASVERTAAVTNQATAINDLTKGFAALVLTSDNSRQRFGDIAARLETAQGEILKDIRAIRNARSGGGQQD